MRTNCGCGVPSCIIPIIVGIIAGILAVLLLTAPVVTVLLWIAFGVTLFALLVLTGIALADRVTRKEDVSKCVCKYGGCLLVAIFGTLVSSIIGLITGVLGTVLLFFVIGFGAWLLTALFILLLCVVLEQCD